MGNVEYLAEQFEGHRRHLHSVAFHLLGSAADADDAVQSAWLKASRADFTAVDNLAGWLTTITARTAVDQLRARARRGEQPLPETLDHGPAALAAEEEALRSEAVSRALLVVLDRLSPAQRAAFVLHEVFDVPFEQIGELLDRSTDAAKKLASRARERLHAEPAAEPRRRAEHQQIVTAFLAASRGGDIPALLELLAPNVVRRVDPVLVPAGVPTEMRGAADVATETRRFTARTRAGAVLLVDGAPGIAIAPGGRLLAVLRIGIGNGRIHTIDIAGEPDRLRLMTLQLPGTDRP
ncbi:sigma-70 family RNA polymerase sigma factor [Mycolicibacter sinensis]|jgi:RNA polymerase sigma-70 factor (ECF subfamily)|uniref:RNA polymerase subunit sigma n=1 Tax=Mycolicibacter sinensis (strain JDM601) TaxID=875328 RepID=A0A1A2ERB3_MYCSD|nr:sigma-70 family RNA polymerase sigma factor [Mycolicibacter sinensis]OBG04352.1 RNA polymerase subunit sigma [Mycolicibacter sinensis]OBG06690.1 RNA polymerase subunit sigma [Mycolicibacter sinensis]